jgi:uncharacterized membrane protein YccC
VKLNRQTILHFVHQQHFTAKMVLAAMLAFSIELAMKVPLHSIMWSLISVFVALDLRVETTLVLSRNRVIGTAVGVVTAALLLEVFNINHLPQLYLCLLIISIVASQIQIFGKGVRVAGVAATIVLFMGGLGTGPWHLAWERFIDISIGVLCALIVSVLVFPSRTKEAISKNLLQLCRLTENLFNHLLAADNQLAANSTQLAAMWGLLEKNNDLAEEISNDVSPAANRIRAWQDRFTQLYLHLNSMSEGLKQIAVQNLLNDMRPEFDQLQTAMSVLLQRWQTRFKTKGEVDLGDARENTMHALQAIDQKFMHLRTLRQFAGLSEPDILSTYTFLYHVRSLVETLTVVIPNTKYRGA